MKKYLLLLFAIGTILVSCKKDPVKPTIVTNEVTNITTTTADVDANVTADGGADVTSKGVCWSMNQNPTIADNNTNDGGGMGAFTSKLTDLIPNTTYYVRAFATNEAGTAYGEQKSFMTLEESEPDDGGEDPDNPDDGGDNPEEPEEPENPEEPEDPDDGGDEIEIVLPQITTATVTEITETSAVAGGDVISDGGAEVTARGVCWSVNPNPTIIDNHTDNGVGTGEFMSNITELTPNTTYYVRAYATNETGTSYGEEISFATLPSVELELPEVTTLSVTEITETSAVAGGDVISDGGAEVTARGVCWSVNPNPTMDDKHTEDGTGVGQFVSNLPNLAINTTYYLRAYATNEVGTSYGEEVTFTTLEGNFINGYEYVDLGLPSGLKWATHNFGATMPYEIGEYLAWGEHKGKDMYSISNSETYGVNIGDFSGDIEYDAAAFTWGGTWRIPTEAETRELKDNCTFEWTEMNGVPGAIVTGPNGNSIFLPSGGFATEGNIDFADSEGAYWTSSPDPSDPMYYACFFYFYNTNFSNIGWFSKYAGLLVRPVAE